MAEEMIDELADGLHVMEPRRLYDPCIVGVLERFGGQSFVVYDRACVLRAIEETITGEEDPDEVSRIAREDYEYNILGAWIGDDTPGFLTRPGHG